MGCADGLLAVATDEGEPMTGSMRGAVPRAFVVILTAVAVVLLATAVVLTVRQHSRDRNRPAALTKSEQAALSAAKQEMINLQTYRLRSFDADFSTAVAGLVPDAASQWQANKATLKNQLTKLKQDSGASVSGAGLLSFTGRSAVVLIASDTLRIDAKGNSTTAAQTRNQVTMSLVSGKWLMSIPQSVPVS
jgi:hypothetical protein